MGAEGSFVPEGECLWVGRWDLRRQHLCAGQSFDSLGMEKERESVDVMGEQDIGSPRRS